MCGSSSCFLIPTFSKETPSHELCSFLELFWIEGKKTEI